MSVGLLGRHSETAVLDATIDAARAGQSSVRVLVGEAGIGKTALLDYAVRSAAELPILPVLTVLGVEAEMELAFAALHQLCAPLLDRLERIPPPQRDALRTAFGLQRGAAPDPFLLGLAALTLLSARAEEGPLLCIIDDVQWLDRASIQVFGFVARRLLAEPIAMLFATRERRPEIQALPELDITGLEPDDARVLLYSAVPAMLDRRVRNRIVAETRGNPLALLEMPRGLTMTELAGGFGLIGASHVSDGIEDSFVARIERLPADARTLLLVAAAESDGDPLLVSRAADRLGVPVAPAAARTETEGLLVMADRAMFRHPLVRSGVYRAASLDERRAVHSALAETIDVDLDPDRRAWHRAAATAGPDETVAIELESAAGRAQSRGGLAAAAAFLQRAAALSGDVQRRGQRAMAAARTSMDAGEFAEANRLLQMARDRPMGQLDSAEADLLAGQLAFAAGPGRDAPTLLLAAARRLEAVDVGRARETYLTAWGAAVFAGNHVDGRVLQEICRGALALEASPGPPRPVDLLLDSLALLSLEGHVAAAGKLRAAARIFADDAIPVVDMLRWAWAATGASNAVWDFGTTKAISLRQVDAVREIGALGQLPLHLVGLSTAMVWLGEFADAAALIAEAETIAAATGSRMAPYADLRLQALRGQESAATDLITSTIAAAAEDGQGMAAATAHWAAAGLHNSLGRYQEAAEAAAQATTDTHEPWVSTWALPELIEAAARLGRDEVARRAMSRLAAATEPCETDVANGITARSRALLTEGAAADALYLESVESLRRSNVPTELARTHLLYGEWLRRQRRRVDARTQLRTGYDMFAAIGMAAFAERARRELLATGETVRKRTNATPAGNDLTTQEQHIALLVRAGLSNPEIGARLFLSPRTVEWHLRKVFAKLAISSRRQLRDTMLESASG